MNAYQIQNVEVSPETNTVTSRGTVSPDCKVWEHHFPGFPVLPGVLMMDLLLGTTEKWYGERRKLRNLRRVRFSNYLKPGSNWESRMRRVAASPENDQWEGEIISQGVKMASAILTLG